jgi:hypothetical protein
MLENATKPKRSSRSKRVEEGQIEKVPITLKVNGTTRSVAVEPRTLLVELIRENFDLT